MNHLNLITKAPEPRYTPKETLTTAKDFITRTVDVAFVAATIHLASEDFDRLLSV